ncbi:hypothetical protein [Streptomyces sp. SID2888]|uniref:hypothetical protein n=1 Tax=Streptomyces sp. SID2888 TaxID=2690256 RepID=UPI0013713095|nr:hypothetical protein [Streptomyces sp. SID2888]MYV46685.1 hypothetical protein [Streptomyces sp. SID2888]
MNTARPTAVPLAATAAVPLIEVTGAPPGTVTAEQPVDKHRAGAEPHASPLVICGAHQVYAPAVPEADTADEVNTNVPVEMADGQVAGLATEQTREVIEACWVNRVNIRETARRAPRSPVYVTKVFTELDEDRATMDTPGQLALVTAGATV